MKAPASTSSNKVRAAVVLACLAAYGRTLTFSSYVHDDQWIVADNPLLRGGFSSIPRLFATGYWEAVRGAAAPVQEYRPLLMISFLFQRMTTGADPRPMHALNLLLHAAVCLLFYELLRARSRAAAAAALFFAVLPVHAEAVCALTGRSELLSSALLLAAWLSLDASRIPAGAALFLAALLTKEHSVLFPFLLALSDWTLKRPRPRLYLLLLAEAAAYLTVRALVLAKPFHAGVPYFSGAPALTVLLTVSKFWVRHYLVAAAAGLGLCSDYSRPLIPDASAGSLSAWACLAALATIAGAASYFLARKRSVWAFWLAGPVLFLLPTSHLLIPIDTLGAERFLYFPTLGLAWLLGTGLASSPAAWALGLWYLGCTAQRAGVWRDPEKYYQAAAACNPVSARARAGLGADLLGRGDFSRGSEELSKAIKLDGRLAAPFYNLGRAAWERKDAAGAERLLREALKREPDDADALVLLAVVLEGKPEALPLLRRAAALMPWDPAAQFDLARALLLAGRPREALPALEKFAALAPDDPDAAWARERIRTLRAEGTGSPGAGE